MGLVDVIMIKVKQTNLYIHFGSIKYILIIIINQMYFDGLKQNFNNER